MECDYFDADQCGSCALMGIPYDQQVHALQRYLERELVGRIPTDRWAAPVTGPESGFRNKAKLVIGGSRSAPTFGILDADRRGVDLRECGLYEPALARAVAALTTKVAGIELTPYDVISRTGEFKHLIVTGSPQGECMARFVLRSPGQLGKLRRAVPELLDAVPGLRVITANLHPDHMATLEGAEEIVLTSADTLPMQVAGVRLQLRPRSFFQTNTAVAERLYLQTAAWVQELGASTLWDLYCGVGGFGLTAAVAQWPQPLDVLGVEVSQDAVQSARQTAEELHLPDVRFLAADASTLLANLSSRPLPDVVVVNPPRRGIGELANWLESSGPPAVIYSSCNAQSLRRDLGAMPSYVVDRAVLFDMFPQTRHHEVLVRLHRQTTRRPPSGVKMA